MRTFIQITCLAVIVCLFTQISSAQEVSTEIEKGKENEVSRIAREHSRPEKREFAFLVRKLIRDGNTITRQQAEQDLDQLEWLLENRFSYLQLNDLDYKAALDTIRFGLADKNYTRQFALELRKFIAQFGDGHSRVRPLSQIIPNGYLAFFPVEIGGKVYAVNDERRRLVVNSYPYIKSIDSVPIARWQKAAELVVTKGSSHFIRHQRQGIMPRIKYLRKELGVKSTRWINLELTNDKGKSLKLKTPLMSDPSKGKLWPRKEHELRKDNIGYLRIPAMTSEPEFLEGVKSQMAAFKETRGLIIDLRNNGGGSRDLLRLLMPYFLSEQSPSRVVNLAAYRLEMGQKADDPEGFLADRSLYPENWQGWGEAEKKAIAQVKAAFTPDWQQPQGKFSDWHYMVVSRSTEPECYFYDKPLVILMNTGCFSATDIFLGAFKGMEKVTLLGEISGGGSGRSRKYLLAHSSLEIRLSSMASFLPDGSRYDGKGVKPDVEYKAVIGDYIGNSDTLLTKAVDMLK